MAEIICMDDLNFDPQNDEEEDFGIIRPTLIKQLRSILDQYPDDGQILKELIQNAEDAGASKVCFLYDETQYGTDPEKLAHPELGVHQGPALYAYNDAVFSDDDWKGIRMLQDSVKTNQPMKVGRFGLGFKSVFHLTDMPSVLSDTYLAFIDPHEKYFQANEGQTTGKKYKLKDKHSLYPHQFEPFQHVFGSDLDSFKAGCYDGTIFRFPLRQAESALSDTLYTAQKMFGLFSAFERDAHLILLFLKHVESVELCVRKKGLLPQTVFKIQLQGSCKNNIRAAREAFLAKLTSPWLEEPAQLNLPIQVEAVKYECGVISQKQTYTWLISEYYAGGDNFTTVLKELCFDPNCKNIPQVGVAYPLGVYELVPNDKVNQGEETMLVQPEGQVFCCLPLPVEQKSSSGLPVHVNGFFSISQDRRRLKWPNQGGDVQSDKEILWNQCLLKELIPKAYVNLVLHAVQLCKEDNLGATQQHIVQALPNKNEVEVRERWKIVLKPFYEQLFEHAVFYSPIEDGNWIHISECIFDCLNETPATCSAVQKVLLSNAIKVVKLPQNVMQALITYSSEDLGNITPKFTRDSIISAATAHHSRLHDLLKNSLTAEEKRGLCEFLGNADNCTLNQKQIGALSTLPLFETIPYGESMTVDFVAVENVPNAAPFPLPIEKVKKPLLNLENECFQSLARVLGVKVLTHAEFITDVVFSELNLCREPEKMKQTMDYIMKNLHQLEQEKRDFVAHLQKFPFLPNKDEKYVSVMELFDPEDKFARSFFHGEDKFPTGIYAQGRQLSFLRQIGLKQGSCIQAEDVVRSALKLHSMRDHFDEKLKKKSHAVVEYLSENLEVLETVFENKLIKDWLCGIAWMSCLNGQHDIFPDGLCFFGGQPILDPGSLLPLEAGTLVGLVASICDSPLAGNVLNGIGLRVIPNVKQVLMQLKKIIEAYLPKDKVKVLPIIKSIYEHVQKQGALSIQKSLNELGLSNWVWHGDGFTTIDRVVSTLTPVDFRPYLFSLPEEMQPFKGMLNELGMPDRCCPKILVAILQNIKEFHSSSAESAGSRAKDLQIAVSILNILKDQLDEVDESLREKIMIPVHRPDERELLLLPIEECTYCDSENLHQGIHSDCDEIDDIFFIHPSIPLSTAEALDVPPLFTRMLQADELPMTGFGQYESLTNRIKLLLEDYTDGYSIIKELVQNADDAGATVVKFLYDERSNIGHEKLLLNEGMKECQGPAFWAYNNAMFSEKDFENITKLGGATKENEIDKIGKFGLGFNAVYNVTDVPSFISGKYLAIFDPQTTHLGRIIRDRNKPGLKINLKKSRMMIRKLSDQFHPYQDVFGCQIDPDDPKDYQGTLFRLPLRTVRQASCSKLSSQSYDKHEIMKLLSIFAKGSESLLFFTQHVTHIELHHIPTNGGETDMLFAMEKKQIKTITPLLNDLGTEFDVLVKCSKDLKGSIQDDRVDQIECLETSKMVEMKTEVTEIGSSFFEKTIESSRKTWMLCFIYNTAQLSEVPERVLSHGFCPYGAVAVLLKECGDDFIPDPLNEGAVYCHLPLPIDSNLPVHINASFAIQLNRRQLHERTVDDKYSWKADWNEFVLKNAVCPAYTLMLRDLLNVNKTTQTNYVNIWPALHSAHGKLEPLVTAFYAGHLEKLVMLYDGEKCITMSEAAIVGKSISCNAEHISLAIEVFKQSGSNLSVVNVPEKILKTMLQLKPSFVCQQMYDDQRFLINIFLPHVSDICCTVRNSVLVWALELDNDKILATIKQTACIPAGPNGAILKMPSELIHPYSKASKLFHVSEQKLVHLDGLGKVIPHLDKLGIKTDYLGWTDIVERGHSIEGLLIKSPREALDRAIIFLAYLGDKLRNDEERKKLVSSEELQAAVSLKKMKILPLVVPPSNSPLKWKNHEMSDCLLVSAVDAHPSTAAALLSSCCPIVDADVIPKEVQIFLELREKTCTSGQVLRQLESHLDLILNLRKTDTGRYLELKSHIEKMYTFLNERARNHDAERQTINDVLGQRECILIDDRLVRPCDLALNDNEGAVTAVLQSVSLLYPWRHFLEALKVKNKFEASDYGRHMKIFKEKYGVRPLSEPQQMNSYIQLVKGLQYYMTRSEISLEEIIQNIGEIYLPTTTGILMPSSDLFFNNCPWTEELLHKLTHTEITYTMAQAFGSGTVRGEMIKPHVSGIPFGQSTNLITSLKRIMEYYPLDNEILKEFIQNADDATATKIHFVLDQRTHGTERLFDDIMKPLQGPALCVYNNKAFTLRDFEGIQKVGEGSKQNDPCKTGKFGIGFNSVYRLTDVPSFLTNSSDKGTVLCFFDPHCSYIPGATEFVPGQKFDSDTLCSQFPDVFTGYLESDFDLQDSTMFRFPLRTKEMARKSQISKQHISTKQVYKMLQNLKSETTDMLLFLNYLEDIELSAIDGQSDVRVFKYAVHANLSDDDKVKRQEFHTKCMQIGERLKSKDIAIEDVKQEKVEYTVCLSHNDGQIEKWRITQVIGFSNPRCVPADIKRAYADGHLALLPRGGVACLLGKGPMTYTWDRNFKGKAYCSLPIPTNTELPVHINGHFALSSESRQHIWLKSGADCQLKLDWNHLLCKEIISTAYVDMLMSIRKDVLGISQVNPNLCSKESIESTVNFYEHFFPQYNEKLDDWNNLVKEVYSLIASTKAGLFPCMKQCGSLENGGIPSWSIEWFSLKGKGRTMYCEKGIPLDSCIPSAYDCLKEILRRCHANIIEIKSSWMKSFEKAGCDMHLASPENVMTFFKSYGTTKELCDLGVILPSPIEHTNIKDLGSLIKILKYCKSSVKSISNLEGTPLLLTNDGLLRVFDRKSPVFEIASNECIEKLCGHIFLHKRLQYALHYLNPKMPIIQQFTVQHLVKFLPKIFPVEYQKEKEVPFKEKDGVYGKVVMEVWNMVSQQAHAYFQNIKGENKEEKDKQMTLTVKNLVNPLKNWCFLPVKNDQGVCLYRVSRAVEIVHVDKRENPWSQWDLLQNAMVKIGIPNLESAFLGQNKEIVQRLLTSFDEPRLVLGAISKVLNKCKDAVPALLSKTEKMKILIYFAKSGLCNADAVTQLKKLPIYETICGDSISLDDSACYVLPADMHTREMDIFRNKQGIVFLRDEKNLRPLFNVLGCSHQSVPELYQNFIFQHFDYLSREAQVSHLQHFHDRYLAEDHPGLSKYEKVQLQSCAADCSIIANESGELHPACYYFDPDVPLFHIMKGDGRLAPKAPSFYSSDQGKWLSMLRKFGLVQYVTAEMCVEFATQIALEGQRNDSSATRQKSKALVEHLWNLKSWNQVEILQKVHSIPFIATERLPRGLTELYPRYGDIGDGRMPYISFKGSFSRKHSRIIWTCASILPQWADPFDKPDGQKLAHILKVEDIPPVDLIAHNFKTICSLWCGRHVDNGDVLKTVCKSFYKFIQKEGLNNNQLKFALQDMKDIPSIAINDIGDSKTFAKPHQASFDMLETDEIRPFFFKVPYDYGDFKPLFLALGVSESPTVDQYVQVLDEMHKLTKGQQLTPNQILLSYKALKGLFLSLELRPEITIKTTFDSLSLLDENGCMCESTNLIFNDAPWLYDRVRSHDLRFLVNLKECGLKDSPENLLVQLPSKYQPKLLSTCVKEVLSKNREMSPASVELAAKLQERLRSHAFLEAIKRLAHHQAQKSGQKLDIKALYSGLDSLSVSNVHVVEKIGTHLIYRDKRVHESNLQKMCYVTKTHDPSGTVVQDVYLKHDAEISNNILIPFAEALNSVLGGILRDSALFLLPVLTCLDTDIKECLDRLDVLPYHLQKDTQEPTLPRAGSIVPNALHHLLVDVEASKLKVGHYVAVNVDEGGYVYGIVRDIPKKGTCLLRLGEKDNDDEIMIASLKAFAGDY